MKIYLRHRLRSLIVAFLAAVGMAAELDAGVWYGSFVGDERWVVGQDNHYYPYGMLMGESSNILISASKQRLTFTGGINPYRFGSKEYLTTNDANLLDFTARTYDPATLLFLTPDPLSEKFLPTNAYLYCLANPVNRFDLDGRDAKLLFDGKTITVKSTIFLTGEHASENIAQIYHDDIMDTWGKIDKFSYMGNSYDVKWDVNVLVEGDEQVDYNGVNNYMDVSMDGFKASGVAGGNHGIIRAISSLGLDLKDDCAMSHEFGHMLGLKDRYDKNTQLPKAGWMNDIMAEPAYQLKTISNHHLETIFKPIINLYNTGALQNNPSLNRFFPKQAIYKIDKDNTEKNEEEKP